MIQAVNGGADARYQKETNVSTLMLNSRGMLVWKSVVYKVDDVVECRLEDNPLTMSVCPQDRRKAAMRSRWFKGTISAIRTEHTPNGDEIVIAVQLPSNNVDKVVSTFTKSLRFLLKRVCPKLQLWLNTRAKAAQTPNTRKSHPNTPTENASPRQVVTCTPSGSRRPHACIHECNIECNPYASTYVLSRWNRRKPMTGN